MAVARYGGKLVACRKRETLYAEQVDHDVRVVNEYERPDFILAGSYVVYGPNGEKLGFISPGVFERDYEVVEDSA